MHVAIEQSHAAVYGIIQHAYMRIAGIMHVKLQIIMFHSIDITMHDCMCMQVCKVLLIPQCKLQVIKLACNLHQGNELLACMMYMHTHTKTFLSTHYTCSMYT